MAIGSFFHFFSSASSTKSHGTKRLSFSKLSSNQKDKNEPSSANNNNNNQDNHTKPDDTVLIRIREQNSGLPSPASSGQQTPGQQGDQLQRSRLRSIVTLSSSSVRTHSIVAHPDPIRIALQSDSDDGQKDNQQETVKVEITPVPSPPIQQPLSTEISSALSRALSSTRSIKFSRTPTPTSTHANPIKKWLVSKYPSNPSTTTTTTHHQDSLQSPARQPVKLSKKKKKSTTTTNQLGIGSTVDQPMKKTLTSTSFLNLINKKQQSNKTPESSNDHHHRPDVLMKTRSDSIVQLDRAHFLNVPKILTSCSDEQQHQLGYPIQEEVLTHQNSPSTTHHNQIHYSPHRPDLVYRPLPPLPQDARSSFDFNHHDGSPIGQIDQSSSTTDSQTVDLTKNPRKTCSRYALADFDLIRTLGTGSFGRVHLSKSRHNGRGYAIKVLNKKRVVGLKQVEHTNSERQMLAAVRHPFLVNLWGTFADSYNLYMVMDFVSGGELFNLLRKSQRFPDPVAKFFGAEVALALDYLHCLNIVYRDLKPENILLGSDGHIKITDFGFAKLVPDITWTLCGTPDYLAPEIVQSKGYNKSVDWYALGVLIFEMLAGYPPFYCEEESPMRLYEKIIAGKVRYPSYFNPSAKDLLKSLLTADLSKRFGNLANGSRDIFHHAWFAEVDWERLYRKQIPAPYVPRVSSEWDSSNFDHYDEASLDEYGKVGEDPYGHLFPGF
ncbi:hypothetical protein Pst134EB_012440 [Puccinia striiformis f. sp. tritici]|nr:hypothetical protein Pst134EB_012440 [Puccinia striiformis f. sp. tritici]